VANFFFTGSSGGQRAINLDQIRLVSRDTVTGRVSISFRPGPKIALDGEAAVRGQGFSPRGGEAERPGGVHTEEAP
jgi:hypothetical protein